MTTCKHCQQPMLTVTCDTCDGQGGWWSDAPHDFRWNECPTCHGDRSRVHCVNTECPGKKWYPLSSSDSAIYRMVVRSIERDEAK